MEWIADHSWLIWLAVALVLAGIEVASVDFVFLMLAGGALGGAAAAGLGLGGVWQVVIACLIAALLVTIVRPMIKRRLMAGISDADIGMAGRVGGTATVLETVTERSGLVKLGGSTWTARLAPGTREVLPGQDVRVESIDGATVIVAPKE